jgi:ribosomal protein L11 methyltransferase
MIFHQKNLHMNKKYIKSAIYTTTQGAEALAPVLERFGVREYSIEDSADILFLMGQRDVLVWDYIDESLIPTEQADVPEARVTFYLNLGKQAQQQIEGIRIALMKLKSDEQYGCYGEGASFGRLWLETETVIDDWTDKYKEFFHAFRPFPGVVIRPPWEQPSEQPEEIEVVIDPGMAFGTGTHETTAMCLEQLFDELRPEDSLLDIGTGSGILAIAAARKQAAAGWFAARSRIAAVEIDPDAIASAEGNIRMNGCEDRIELICGDILENDMFSGNMSFRIITANMTSGILKRALPVLRQLLDADGRLILSGILDAQEDMMRAVIEEEGLSVAKITNRGEWLMLMVIHA